MNQSPCTLPENWCPGQHGPKADCPFGKGLIFASPTDRIVQEKLQTRLLDDLKQPFWCIVHVTQNQGCNALKYYYGPRLQGLKHFKVEEQLNFGLVPLPLEPVT